MARHIGGAKWGHRPKNRSQVTFHRHYRSNLEITLPCRWTESVRGAGGIDCRLQANPAEHALEPGISADIIKLRIPFQPNQADIVGQVEVGFVYVEKRGS